MKTLFEVLNKTRTFEEACFVKVQTLNNKRTIENDLKSNNLVIYSTKNLISDTQIFERILENGFNYKLFMSIKGDLDLDSLYEFCKFLNLKNQNVIPNHFDQVKLSNQ